MKLEEQPDLFRRQLQELYNAEAQITLAMPRVAARSSIAAVKSLLTEHLEETRSQVLRLEQIGRMCDCSCSGVRSLGMQGILAEGEEAIGCGGDPVLVELALLGACQKVEHYEMSAYTMLRELAIAGGLSEAIPLIEATRKEEMAAAKNLERAANSLLARAKPDPVEVS
ncbi:MAG: DUF892 family protein [Phycisphaerales bacterium]